MFQRLTPWHGLCDDFRRCRLVTGTYMVRANARDRRRPPFIVRLGRPGIKAGSPFLREAVVAQLPCREFSQGNQTPGPGIKEAQPAKTAPWKSGLWPHNKPCNRPSHSLLGNGTRSCHDARMRNSVEYVQPVGKCADQTFSQVLDARWNGSPDLGFSEQNRSASSFLVPRRHQHDSLPGAEGVMKRLVNVFEGIFG